MIADQSVQPVSLDLAFGPGGSGVTSGTVSFGVLPIPGRRERDDELENALLAFPHETAAELKWAYVFTRGSSSWVWLPTTGECR